jgi:acetyl esterase
VTATEEVHAGSTSPVRLRIYRGRTGRPGPLLLWMHGGGFVGGSLDMPEADAVCRALAVSGITCVSVDYRLCPDSGDAARRRHQTPPAIRRPLMTAKPPGRG